MNYMQPFTSAINLAKGDIPTATTIITRRIADMRGLYADVGAEQSLLAENPLVYEVFYGWNAEEVEGQLGFCTTIIQPGKVGDEFFMTKGHYHAKGDRAEVYYGVLGEGLLVLQTPAGEINTQEMKSGTVAYVPPFWGHRTVNTGKDNFVFLAVYPADAGYDYATIAERGFASIIVERDDKAQAIPNPRYK